MLIYVTIYNINWYSSDRTESIQSVNVAEMSRNTTWLCERTHWFFRQHSVIWLEFRAHMTPVSLFAVCMITEHWTTRQFQSTC